MGGTQFNGLALVRELVKSGHDVTVLNRGKTQSALPRSVKRLTADRTDAAQLRAVLKDDWDCVQDMCAYHPEDVKTMIELLHGRTGHYVFASSTVTYAPSNLLPISEDFPDDRGPKQNEYGLHKLLCEDILFRAWRERGFPATSVAFSMVFGPNNILPDREQRMFVRLLRGRKVLIPGDGTTVGQVGHVDDEARALRMLMQNTRTFGRRYNLTGGDYYTDEGYVDTFAEILGVEAKKVFVPAALMDELYDGKVLLAMAPMKSHIDIRSTQKIDPRAAQLFNLQRLIQRIAPNLHRWNRSVVFSTARLQEDVGWKPEYTFRSAVAQTWDWMQSERRHETLDFDYGFEDELLRRLGIA
jgi:nucleoside-diphosphate-sugar epimerase